MAHKIRISTMYSLYSFLGITKLILILFSTSYDLFQKQTGIFEHSRNMNLNL
jgi:hypothetical protein